MSKNFPSAEYFKQVAVEWDNLRAGYFTDSVRAAALGKAYLRPEHVVADVGAGTGFMAAGIAPIVRQVYVLDASPVMLAVAQENLRDFNNVVFQEADGSSLPLPEASLDVVFANMYLHHCPDPQAAIREMARILRPGGRLEVSDIVTNQAFPREMIANAADWAGCVFGALPEQEYLDLVAQAGFGDVVVRRSPAVEVVPGVTTYSIIVSARKSIL